MNHWFFDGTFASTPPGFEQVLTVAVEMKGVVVSPIMVLMTCRAQELYDEVIARLHNDFPEMAPTHIHSDFELAIGNAVCKTFPGCAVCGCSFHFRQSIGRQLRKGIFNLQTSWYCTLPWGLAIGCTSKIFPFYLECTKSVLMGWHVLKSLKSLKWLTSFSALNFTFSLYLT